MIILVAYPQLEKLIFPIEDIAIVGAFLAFASLLGGAAIGFLVSQVWYVFFLYMLRGKYGRLPETRKLLEKKFNLTENINYQLRFLDYILYHSKEQLQTRVQRRYDLIHLCGSTLVSTIIGVLLGILIRIGILPNSNLSDIRINFSMTTLDVTLIIIIIILVFLLVVGLHHAMEQHAMISELSITTVVMNPKKLEKLNVKQEFPKEYFKKKNSD
jgi:hypothetical protein